jgi:hypothetical protein
VDGWTATRGTADGNIDGIGGEDNTLRLTSDVTASSHLLQKLFVFTVGRKYTVTFKYYIPSGQSNIDGIRLHALQWGEDSTFSTLDSWTAVTKTFTAPVDYIRIYGSDGGATSFTDAGGDDVFYIKDITISEIQPYMDGNHQIEIYDSSNRMLRGVLKAAGTSETLDTDLLAGLDITSGWIAVGSPATTINDANTYTANATYGGVRRSLWTVGGLYKGSLDVTVTGTSTYTYLGRTPGNQIFDGESDKYITSSVDNSVYIATSGTTAGTVTDINSAVLQQVLTPSSSGATIVSAKGGETYNFSYKNPSFTYNSSSYYCIIKTIR